MEITNKVRNILNSDFIRIWISVLTSFVCGYIMIVVVMYLLSDELFDYFIEDVLGVLPIYVLIISFLLVTTSIILKLHKINKVELRFLLCFCIHLFWGLLFVIVRGSDSVTIYLIKLNSNFLDSLINYSGLVIPVVLGLIFLKPWRSIGNFFAGAVYAAILYIVQMIYGLTLVGIIYDNWL